MPALRFAGDAPTIDPTAWLAPTATVIGRASIAADTSLFYGAVVRADMDRDLAWSGQQPAGQRCGAHRLRIPDPDQAGVSVGHDAVSRLFGRGQLPDRDERHGSQRGGDRDGSLVAAGTVVLEGTRIPPHSLVAGVPGKVRRELTDEEYAKVMRNAEHYRGLAARHRAAQG